MDILCMWQYEEWAGDIFVSSSVKNLAIIMLFYLDSAFIFEPRSLSGI